MAFAPEVLAIMEPVEYRDLGVRRVFKVTTPESSCTFATIKTPQVSDKSGNTGQIWVLTK